MIVGAFSEMLPSGGIQRVSLQTAAVLTEWAAERGEAVAVLSLNEAVGEHRVQVGGVDVTVRGFAGSRTRFVAAVLRLGRRADTVLLGHPGFAPLCSALRLLRPGVRTLVFAYGVDVWSRRPLDERLGLRAASGVLSISEYTSRKLVELNDVAPGQIHLLYCSLPPGAEDERLAAAPRAEPAGPVLLSVSRLWAVETGKGIDTVIRALPRVLARAPGAEYWIVGDGDARPGLEALAREMGVAGRVRFMGRVSDGELLAAYQAADVFLLPSNQEGFGIVYVEAMRQGCPVIAGNHGGAPEVVDDGVTGFLVEHGDETAIATRVVQLLEDPELRARMGRAARARVEELFTHRRFRDRVRQILAALDPAPVLAAGV